MKALILLSGYIIKLSIMYRAEGFLAYFLTALHFVDARNYALPHTIL